MWLLVADYEIDAGNTRLRPELAELGTLRAAHGDETFAAALDRAVAFSRWRAADVRSILAAGLAGLSVAADARGIGISMPERFGGPAARIAAVTFLAAILGSAPPVGRGKVAPGFW